MNLQSDIEDLISQNADSFQVSKLIRDNIKDYLNSLEEIFTHTQGKSFLVKHTKKIDYFIKTIYKYIIRVHFGNYMPMHNSIPITLLALGSYGREQLCVYSDIDFMIVYKKIPGFNIMPIIESILHIAWDSGLKLGHRTHEVSDLFKASCEDETIKTAMIESRYICGSKFLFIESETELNKIKEYQKKEFITTKVNALEVRRKKYPLNMQPNIKEGTGSLRDFNTLFWISNILYNATKIKDLTPKFISEHEYKELMSSVEFLYKIRIALHLSANKKTDTLRLEYIPDVAKKLGFKDKVYSKAQTNFIKKTLHAMWTIKFTTEFLIKKLISKIYFNKTNISKLKDKKIFTKCYLCNNTVYASLHVKEVKFSEVFEGLILPLKENVKYDISFAHYLKHVASNSKEDIITFKSVKELFYKDYLYELFSTLYEAQILYAIIPPLRRVANLAQFDGYHTYPVDIHSIKTLYFLENISNSYVKEIYETLSLEEKAVLKVTALLHDAGKGRKKDHSEVGAFIIKNFLQKLNFNAELIKYAVILVKYHTLMSNIAKREDIYSQRVVFSFISKLKNIKTLQMLYVLTYTDINAVGPGTYSSFSAKLLKELYHISYEAFDKDELIGEATRRARKEKSLKRNPDFLQFPIFLKKKILTIESNIFFLKFKEKEIIEICTWANSLKKVYDYKVTNEEHLSISIIKTIDLNLGYLLGKLAILDLDIVNMDIYKLFNSVKYFKIDFLEKVADEDLLYIQEIIENSFDMNKKIKLNKPKILQNEIKINCKHSKTYALMSTNCQNQKALLANIISIFDNLGIEIASAKIETIKNRAINLFLIEKNGKFCNNLEIILKNLIDNKN